MCLVLGFNTSMNPRVGTVSIWQLIDMVLLYSPMIKMWTMRRHDARSSVFSFIDNDYDRVTTAWRYTFNTIACDRDRKCTTNRLQYTETMTQCTEANDWSVSESIKTLSSMKVMMTQFMTYQAQGLFRVSMTTIYDQTNYKPMWIAHDCHHAGYTSVENKIKHNCVLKQEEQPLQWDAFTICLFRLCAKQTCLQLDPLISSPTVHHTCNQCSCFGIAPGT